MKFSLILLMIIGLLAGCMLSSLDQPLTLEPETTTFFPSCDISRPLNPDPEPQPNETVLDRYFRLAFTQEVSGNFTKAIDYYQQAANLSQCECDHRHALAGKQAAEESQNLLEKEGIESKPTQFFWVRLQELTENLPCIQVQ